MNRWLRTVPQLELATLRISVNVHVEWYDEYVRLLVTVEDRSIRIWRVLDEESESREQGKVLRDIRLTDGLVLL